MLWRSDYDELLTGKRRESTYHVRHATCARLVLRHHTMTARSLTHFMPPVCGY